MFLIIVLYQLSSVFLNEERIDYLLVTAITCVYFPHALMLMSFCVLICLMSKYHHFEMRKIWCSLFSFVLFEFIVGILEGFLIYYYKTWPELEAIVKLYYNQCGAYIILQGLGLIFIKKTKDPLERISKIGYLQIISINQRLTPNFIENM